MVPVTAGAMRLKRRWMGPAFIAKAIEARGAGAMETPARSGLKCQTFCMNRAVLSRVSAQEASETTGRGACWGRARAVSGSPSNA
ncbi:hypothetical protein GCM10011579_082420 [Streptomyces albiflavescens]|uniref:Uncharacterized protein n=1 Tax=Streptomyces albiflavescens TaxID=1623582 RepID=A0A917YE05_9ACTN|nr:hypothetical protein GCM10011579_082420 [Streptomyces albiflavescens]